MKTGLRLIFAYRLLVLISSIGLFIASLFQDGFLIEGSNPRAWAPCFGLLLIGWIGIFQGNLTWLANPLILFAWLAYADARSRYQSIPFASLSLCFALSFMLYGKILSSEAGHYSKVTSLELGYWLWVASITSMIVLPLTELLFIRLQKDPHVPEG